jgi:hypothetical protein
MNSAKPRHGEKRVLQEDCAEDKLSNGILTLTNQRIIFEKTQGRIATLSKTTGDMILDIPLDKISSVSTEGFIIKKVVISMDDMAYKFGVFNTRKWAKEIEKQMSINKVK